MPLSSHLLPEISRTFANSNTSAEYRYNSRYNLHPRKVSNSSSPSFLSRLHHNTQSSDHKHKHFHRTLHSCAPLLCLTALVLHHLCLLVSRHHHLPQGYLPPSPSPSCGQAFFNIHPSSQKLFIVCLHTQFACWVYFGVPFSLLQAPFAYFRFDGSSSGTCARPFSFSLRV